MQFIALLKQVVWCLLVVHMSVTCQEELCGAFNSRTVYLQLGEHDSIVLHNQSWSQKKPLRCNTELITCPSCSIQLTVTYLDLPQTCTHSFMLRNTSYSPVCPCGGLSIWQPLPPSSPLPLCSPSSLPPLTSTTRSLSLFLDYMPNNFTGHFLINFTAQKNQNIVNGVAGESGYVTSPNFPSLYPRDFGIEHILTCSTQHCLVSFMFTDFLISTSSIMEFYDFDGKPLHLTSGVQSRPKPVLSTGPSLTIRFFANSATGLGYKAAYHFVTDAYTAMQNVSTDCGGEVDDVGGTIYMTGVTGYYDCVWLVHYTNLISHYKTHLYLRVEHLEQGELKLYQGQTSEDRLIETLPGYPEAHPSIEHVSPITQGFYISYRGNVSSDDILAITYSAFSYMDCMRDIEYLCGNKRCVSNTLLCDTFDNCGDNTDELNCKPDLISPRESRYWWPYRLVPPPSGSAGGALLALGAALTGSAVLLAITLCRVAVRMSSPAHSHSQHHMDHIRTIAHLLSIGSLDEREDDPPMYEPPPEYNQVVKAARPRRKHSTRRLIESNTTTPVSSSIVESNELQCSGKEKEQLISIPPQGPNGVVRLPDCQTDSLDTTGYNEEMGYVSLTLSTSSQKGNNGQPNYSKWLSPTMKSTDTKASSSGSILSFDTYTSDTSFPPHNRQLIKSHSQDNILRFPSEGLRDTNPSYFHSCLLENRFKNKPTHFPNRNSLDSIDMTQYFQPLDFVSTVNQPSQPSEFTRTSVSSE